MQKVIGILSGGGSLPCEIAQSISSAGNQVVIIAIEGEANPEDFMNFNVTFVKWGEVGRIIRIFRQNKVKDIVIIGSVKRPNLKNFRTDFGFYKNLFFLFNLIRAGGDDGVLRLVIKLIEKKGFRVLGPKDVAPELIISDGPLGKRNVPDILEADIQYGFNLLEQLAPFDIGQSIVIQRGKVFAIEAAEGTDRMLDRVASNFPRKDQIGVLIKRSKPGQELRIDMPTIGPLTIEKAANAGLGGIVVQSGVTLAAQKKYLINKADEKNIFVTGISPFQYSDSYKVPSLHQKNDFDLALNVLRILATLDHSCGVVSIRRHIIAIETGEGLSNLLQRTSQLRQWGAWHYRRRGTLAVTENSGLTFDHIRSVASLGFSTIVLLTRDQYRVSQHVELQNFANSLGLDFKLEVSLKPKVRNDCAA